MVSPWMEKGNVRTFLEDWVRKPKHEQMVGYSQLVNRMVGPLFQV